MLSALISLEVSMQDGRDYNTTYLRKGKVQVSNLTCYNPTLDCEMEVREDGLAHVYGEGIVGQRCGAYHELTDVINSEQDYPYYCRREPGRHEFAYRFSEYNPNDTQKSYPHFTNRIVTASSGVCIEHEQVSAVRTNLVDDSAFLYNYTIATKQYNFIAIPTSFLGSEGTTYIWRDWARPEDLLGLWSCGDRCLWMWVYTNVEGAGANPKFYECPVTVSEVSNSARLEHKLSNYVARLAVASIALQGRFRYQPAMVYWEQFQFYATG